MENVRNHIDIKLLTTNKRRSKLASESNYHHIIKTLFGKTAGDQN